MTYAEDYEIRRAQEQARVANFPNQLQRLAHMLLTNRALAGALLQLDTDSQRYADICKFLDERIRILVQQACSLEVPQPPNDPEDDDDEPDAPQDWTEDETATCCGKTLKGEDCRTRACYCYDGKPYCRRHYPYSAVNLAHKAAMRDREDEWRLKYDRYRDAEKELLEKIDHLDRCWHGLSDMNNTLKEAFQHLAVPAPPVPRLNMPRGPAEVTRVDGLTFRLEKTNYPDPSFWLIGTEDERMDAVLRPNGSGWIVFLLDPNTGQLRPGGKHFGAASRDDAVRLGYLYSKYYRIRLRREVAWFTSVIHDLVSDQVDLSSVRPLAALCGIAVPQLGWHVFRRTTGRDCDNFRCVYSGHAEAEARWEFATESQREIAAVLVNPSNQPVEQRIDTKRFW